MTHKHIEPCARDPLDDIDEIAAQITDEHIEARLRDTLRRAGRNPAQQGEDHLAAEADKTWLPRLRRAASKLTPRRPPGWGRSRAIGRRGRRARDTGLG